VFFAGIKARHIIPKQAFLVKPADCGLGAVAGLFFAGKLTIISERKPKRLTVALGSTQKRCETINHFLPASG